MAYYEQRPTFVAVRDLPVATLESMQQAFKGKLEIFQSNRGETCVKPQWRHLDYFRTLLNMSGAEADFVERKVNRNRL